MNIEIMLQFSRYRRFLVNCQANLSLLQRVPCINQQKEREREVQQRALQERLFVSVISFFLFFKKNLTVMCLKRMCVCVSLLLSVLHLL